MTFCMAFSANPDGIAVIADTRITLSNSFRDGYQKIIFPTDNSFIAVAGSIEILMFVLEDVSDLLQSIAPHTRVDALRNRIRERIKVFVSDNSVQESRDGASFIYGDVRMNNGPTHSRLLRFDLTFSESGAPLITEQKGSNFSSQEAKKFPQDQRINELPWLCIGTNPGTRNFFGNTAMNQIRQFLPCSLEISTAINLTEIKARGKVYQEINFRGRSRPHGDNTAVFLSTAGPPDGSFRRKLRSFANEKEKNGEHTPFDVINFLGWAALKRIELLMTEVPGAMGLDTISETWTLATISRRGGIRLMAGDDPNAVTMSFGLRDALN